MIDCNNTTRCRIDRTDTICLCQLDVWLKELYADSFKRLIEVSVHMSNQFCVIFRSALLFLFLFWFLFFWRKLKQSVFAAGGLVMGRWLKSCLLQRKLDIDYRIIDYYSKDVYIYIFVTLFVCLTYPMEIYQINSLSIYKNIGDYFIESN